MVLAESGYAPTSSALEILERFSQEPQHLVWVEIARAYQRLLDVWWEQPQAVQASIRKCARKSFEPLVSRLGFAHQDEDDADTRQFRVLALAGAAAAEDPV